MSRRRIAIVTPWYGAEATGGAETLARELAAHLSPRDDVTILTTTARAFLADWGENHFKPGRVRENGYDVLRFGLGDRNGEAFDRLNGELMQMPRAKWKGLIPQRARMDPFIDESINSPWLEQYLQGSEAANYDAVVFLPYLYGVVVRGIEAFAERAHLLPCLHDEVYARLPRIEDAVHRAKTLLFNSDGEAELALRIYGPGVLEKSYVIGSGILPATGGSDSRIVDGPYFLYLGRRDATKGVDFLIEAFSRYRRERSSTYSLVLAGVGNTSYHDPENGIVDFGFVDEDQKRGLISHARALVQPSENESYSRVIMEAWQQGIAVIVRARCLATATAVRRSGGGLIADGVADWVEAFRSLEVARPEELAELGRLGNSYAAVHSDWSNVIERFREATGIGTTASHPKRGKRVDQVLATLTYGDAISDYARFLRTHLEAQGYESSIYARNIHPRVAADAVVISADAVASSDALVYHHSIAFSDLNTVLDAAQPKALVYHNITPARFFRDYDTQFSELLDSGRSQLGELAGAFEAFGADSDFNAQELRDLGFQNVTVVPVPVNFSRFDVTPASIARDGVGTQWLFVGRIAPNKGIRPLIEAFDVYGCLDPSARLVIVGAYDPADRYYQELSTLLIKRGLETMVVFAGVVDEATLTAHYRNADVYVCLSEHEGFCVPLVEAMFFDIPIVARANTAIIETLGASGVLIDADADSFEIAAVAREIHTDEKLRGQIVDSQRAHRVSFLPARISPIVDAFVAGII